MLVDDQVGAPIHISPLPSPSVSNTAPFAGSLRSEMSLMPCLSAVSRVTQMPCVAATPLGLRRTVFLLIDVFLDERSRNWAARPPDRRRPRRNRARRTPSCVPISRTSTSRPSFSLMPYLMMLAAAWPDGQLGIATSRSAPAAMPQKPASENSAARLRAIQLFFDTAPSPCGPSRLAEPAAGQFRPIDLGNDSAGRHGSCPTTASFAFTRW